MQLKGIYWAVDYAKECDRCLINWAIHPKAAPCNACLEDIRQQEQDQLLLVDSDYQKQRGF